MLLAILIGTITCLCMILAVLFYPKIRLGRICVSSYWVITLLGALALILTRTVRIGAVGAALVADTAINPLKILTLFISMTLLSIYLDELGFFRFLASCALRHAGNSQLKLFVLLYVTVSVLTVFTSNDIIILSFTPFVCYFAKNARINPLPYLAAEFVAANTWSMALIIGNPTNIYLVTATGGDFLSYLNVMLPVTLASGVVACLFLFVLFRKKLSAPICATPQEVVIEDKFALWVGIVHLAVCTAVLAFGSYFGIEMWLVSLFCALSLLLWSIGISACKKKGPRVLVSCLRRAPWELIPFVISMFVIVEAFNVTGVTEKLFLLLGGTLPVWTYGISSFLMSNLINNIPMSVLYSAILSNAAANPSAVFATVVGSNLGACLTPIGALAGIMWSSILKEHGLKFGYADFLKIGVTVAIPALLAALGVLQIWL